MTPARAIVPFAGLFGLLTVLALLACGAPDKSRWPRLKVLVAEDAMPYLGGIDAMIHDYNYRMGVAIDLTTLSTAMILPRLAQTPPPDLVVACDPRLTAELRRRALLDEPQWLLERVRDKLALVAPRNSPLTVGRLEDLRHPDLRALGLTDPKPSRVGGVARDALHQAGLLEPLTPLIRQFKSQDELVAALQAGSIQAGFIRQSQLARFAGAELKPLLIFDPRADTEPSYIMLAVLRGSARRRHAHQFWGYFQAAFHFGMLIPPTADGGSLVRLPEESS